MFLKSFKATCNNVTWNKLICATQKYTLPKRVNFMMDKEVRETWLPSLLEIQNNS
jgi:hypothetical protein